MATFKVPTRLIRKHHYFERDFDADIFVSIVHGHIAAIGSRNGALHIEEGYIPALYNIRVEGFVSPDALKAMIAANPDADGVRLDNRQISLAHYGRPYVEDQNVIRVEGRDGGLRYRMQIVVRNSGALQAYLTGEFKS